MHGGAFLTTAQPSTSQPSTAQPSTAQPSTAQPSTSQARDHPKHETPNRAAVPGAPEIFDPPQSASLPQLLGCFPELGMVADGRMHDEAPPPVCHPARSLIRQSHSSGEVTHPARSRRSIKRLAVKSVTPVVRAAAAMSVRVRAGVMWPLSASTPVPTWVVRTATA